MKKSLISLVFALLAFSALPIVAQESKVAHSDAVHGGHRHVAPAHIEQGAPIGVKCFQGIIHVGRVPTANN